MRALRQIIASERNFGEAQIFRCVSGARTTVTRSSFPSISTVKNPPEDEGVTKSAIEVPVQTGQLTNLLSIEAIYLRI